MPNTIKLKKYQDIINEYEAEAAITPGMLIELTSSNTVQAHRRKPEPYVCIRR